MHFLLTFIPFVYLTLYILCSQMSPKGHFEVVEETKAAKTGEAAKTAYTLI